MAVKIPFGLQKIFKLALSPPKGLQRTAGWNLYYLYCCSAANCVPSNVMIIKLISLVVLQVAVLYRDADQVCS
jgi:hypothetical protein